MEKEIQVGDYVKTYKSGLYKVRTLTKAWKNKTGQGNYWIEDETDPRCDKDNFIVWADLIRTHDTYYNPIKKSRVLFRTTASSIVRAQDYCKNQIDLHINLLEKLKEDGHA